MGPRRPHCSADHTELIKLDDERIHRKDINCLKISTSHGGSCQARLGTLDHYDL